MDEADFKAKKKVIDELAGKYKWSAVSFDSSTGRLSYMDELSVFKIDLYTSKMTVCVLPKGDKPVYFKRQNYKMIEKILKNPYRF